LITQNVVDLACPISTHFRTFFLLPTTSICWLSPARVRAMFFSLYALHSTSYESVSNVLMRTPRRSRVVMRHEGLRAVTPLKSVMSKPISTLSVFRHSLSSTSRMLKCNYSFSSLPTLGKHC